VSLLEGKGRFVTVTGAVRLPGNKEIEGDAHVADIVTKAGPMIERQEDSSWAFLSDLSGAQVIRNGKPLPIDVSLAMQGNPRHNVRVRPGDLIFVPPDIHDRIIVLGETRNRTVSYHPKYRLLELLAQSGFTTAQGDAEDIRIIRGGRDAPRMFVANARDIIAGQRKDVYLAPGDIVFVTQTWNAPFDLITRYMGTILAYTVVRTAVSQTH
jgi:polysaccharide export outer membrane protein